MSGGLFAGGDNQAANSLFAGPATGAAAAPGFRAQVIADLPANIPNSSLFNQGSADFIALKELGSALKAWPPGLINPIYPSFVTLASQLALWIVVYQPVAALISKIQYLIYTPAVYTTSGYNGFALYSLNAGTGQLTQIAATTSNPTLWTASIGWNAEPLATPVNTQEGVYVIALLWQASAFTTAPVMSCWPLLRALGDRDFPNQIKLTGSSSGSTLPASINFSAIGNVITIPYVYLL